MFFPNKRQFNNWSVPSKWSYVSGVVGIMAFVIGIIFWACPRSNSAMQYTDVENIANIVISRVLEGSSLCCDIKTAEVVFYLPEEKEFVLKANMLIGFIPDSINQTELAFSFSTNINDSTKLFTCKDIGKNEVDIFFFKRSKIFCSKPSILDLRDPSHFCKQLLK